MSRDVIRLGLVGLGEHVVENLWPSLAARTDSLVTAWHDPLVRKIPAQLTEVEFTSLESLVLSDKVDAIICAASPQVHRRCIELAVSAGKPCFVEKPLCADSDVAEDLLRLSLARNVPVSVGLNFRHSPAYQVFLSQLQRNGGGQSSTLQYFAGKPQGDRWGLGDPLRSFLLSHATHAIDLLVASASGTLALEWARVARVGDGFTLGCALVDSDSGFYYMQMTNGAPRFNFGLSVQSRSGSVIEMQGLSRVVASTRDESGSNKVSELWSSSTVGTSSLQAGYLRELDEFVSLVASGTPRVSDSLERAVCGLRVIDAIYRTVG